MKAWLLAQWTAFLARPPRERWLLLGALLAVLLWLGDRTLTGPAWRARAQAQVQAQRAAQALGEAKAQHALVRAERERQRQEQAAERVQLQQQLVDLQAASPVPLDGPRTLALLETLVLRQQGRLQLVAMTALPDGTAATLASPAPAASQPFYRHGLQLVVQGDFQALHDYLQALAQERALRVRGFQLSVLQHPQLELSLQVETLSPQPEWLTL